MDMLLFVSFILLIACRVASLRLSSLPPQAYSSLGSVEICRVIVGTWAACKSGLEERDLVTRFTELAGR